MLCERCKQNPATVHYTQIINGKITEYHLCDACAREEKLSSQMQEFDIFNLFSPRREGRDPGLICPVCKTTLAEFREHGIAGCDKCYDVFSPVILPMLKQVHGSTAHLKPSDKKEETPEEKIARLQKEIKNAVAAEDYEKAAALRDEIKGLKGESL